MFASNDLDGNIYIGYDIATTLSRRIKTGYRVVFSDLKQYTFYVNADTGDKAVAAAHEVYTKESKRKISDAATFQRI